MMDINSFLEKIKSGEVHTTSKYALRDESAQVKFRGLQIPKFQRDKSTNWKLLTLTELAAPFNPVALDDEGISEECKFRPEQSFTTVAGAIKLACQNDSELKEKVMNKLGLEDWDTSSTEITKEDIDKLTKIRVPRVFSFNVISIISQIMNNTTFACDYKVNWEVDELGEVKGEYPTLLKVNSLFLTSLLEEYKEWETANASKSEKDKKEQKATFLKRNPVGNDRPKNYVICVRIPLDNAMKVKEEVYSWTAEDVKKNLVHMVYSGDFKTNTEALVTTYKETRDLYADFLEIDVRVGDEEDKGARALNTQYVNSEFKLRELPKADKILAAITECVDSIENLEGTMIKATRLRTMDESNEAKLLESLGREFDIKTLKITEQLVTRYGDIISDIWGNDGDEAIMLADCGMADEGTVTESEVFATKKDLREILSDDSEIDILEE